MKVMTQESVLHLCYQYEDTADIDDARVRNHRAGVEAIIGHIKHGGQLGKTRMKSDRTTIAAGYAAMAGFNLRQLMHKLDIQNAA